MSICLDILVHNRLCQLFYIYVLPRQGEKVINAVAHVLLLFEPVFRFRNLGFQLLLLASVVADTFFLIGSAAAQPFFLKALRILADQLIDGANSFQDKLPQDIFADVVGRTGAPAAFAGRRLFFLSS